MPALTISTSISALIHGFLLCASIIMALGPQNLFIIRQGLQRRHVFATAFFSTLADIVLITVAVGGLSAVIASSDHFRIAITILGMLFLVYVGGSALLRAFRKGSLSPKLTAQEAATSGVWTTIIAALCFSLLNPGLYIDTLLIIGSSSLNFSASDRLLFAIGAMLASTAWFFTLSYGAGKLTPVFQSHLAWRALDMVRGVVMLGIASTLVSTLAPVL